MAAKGKKDPAPAEDVGGGNINQIRDILVGPFQREQESRLASLEKALERYQAESEAATQRAQQKLEKKIETTTEKLSEKISELGKALKATEKAQGKALEKAQSDLATELAGLEQLMEEQIRALREDVESGMAELRDAKVGREDLGDYLMEIGLRLKGESALQSIEGSLKSGKGGAAYS